MVVSENYICVGVLMEVDDIIKIANKLPEDVRSKFQKLYDETIGAVLQEAKEGKLKDEDLLDALNDVRGGFGYDTFRLLKKNKTDLFVIPVPHDVANADEKNLHCDLVFVGINLFTYNEQKRTKFSCNLTSVVKALARFATVDGVDGDMKWLEKLSGQTARMYRMADDCDCCS